MKVSVASTDLTDSVFAHQYRRMKVVTGIAPQVGKFFNRQTQDFGMAIGRFEEPESGRSQKGRQETPGLIEAPGFDRAADVRGDAQELVANVPGEVNRRRANTHSID